MKNNDKQRKIQAKYRKRLNQKKENQRYSKVELLIVILIIIVLVVFNKEL